MKHSQQKKKKTDYAKDKVQKTYIPQSSEDLNETDLFVDLLSYGRRSFSSKSDIWTFEYV